MGIDARIGCKIQGNTCKHEIFTDFPVHGGGKTRTCIVRRPGLPQAGIVVLTGNISRAHWKQQQGSTGNNDKNAASNSDISTIGYSNKSRVNVLLILLTTMIILQEDILSPDDGERFAFSAMPCLKCCQVSLSRISYIAMTGIQGPYACC